MQDFPHGRVLEIERHYCVAQLSPSPQREPSAGLVELLSSMPEVSVSLISASSWVRALHTVLAGLTGAVWAFSLASLPLSTGWPAVFNFGYAAASAGFTVVRTLAALNSSGAEKGAQLARTWGSSHDLDRSRNSRKISVQEVPVI